MKIIKEQIIEFMKDLTDEERLEIIKSFCSECGSINQNVVVGITNKC